LRQLGFYFSDWLTPISPTQRWRWPYDPRHLAQHSLIGVVGDETKARSWYQRASELGSIEAGRILARTDAD
jgi:hypothetical protein